MKIKIGDLVKMSGIVAHTFGTQFGTVVRGPLNIEDHGGEKWEVMMYRAGLGQYLGLVHTSYLEVIPPVERL